MREITLDEFCEMTGTPADSWIFGVPEVNHYFLRDDCTGLIYYINSDGDVMRFKRMEEDGEIMSSEAQWELWNVWEVLDDEREQ